MKEYTYPDLRDFFREKEDRKRLKKCAKQRARFGLAYCDTWNFDDFLLKIIIRGLRQLADNSHGYPGVEPFDTFEKWKNFLLDLADKFERASRYIYDFDPDENSTVEERNARYKTGEDMLKEAFAELAEWLTAMWD